jgi:hypothetical protein
MWVYMYQTPSQLGIRNIQTGETRSFPSYGSDIVSHYISGTSLTIETEEATIVYDIDSSSTLDFIRKY